GSARAGLTSSTHGAASGRGEGPDTSASWPASRGWPSAHRTRSNAASALGASIAATIGTLLILYVDDGDPVPSQNLAHCGDADGSGFACGHPDDRASGRGGQEAGGSPAHRTRLA